MHDSNLITYLPHYIQLTNITMSFKTWNYDKKLIFQALVYTNIRNILEKGHIPTFFPTNNTPIKGRRCIQGGRISTLPFYVTNVCLALLI